MTPLTAELGSIHTTLEEIENTAFFLWLGLPSTLIRHENRAFRNHCSNRKKLKTRSLRFSVDERTFKNKTFRKDDVTIIT